MLESNELQAIGPERVVRCTVVRPFRPGGAVQDAEHHVGDVVRLPAPVALENAQTGHVRVEREKDGRIATDPNPDYVAPSPAPTARIRVRIASRHHPIGEPELRHCEPGEVIEVLEARAVLACAGSNPAAERVA